MVSKLLHFFGIFTVVSIKYSPISELWSSSEVRPREINGQTPLDKHVLKLRDVFRLHLTLSGYIAGQMRSSNNTFSYSLAQKHFLTTLKHAIFKYAHWHSKLTRDHAVHLTWTAATCWTLFFFWMYTTGSLSLEQGNHTGSSQLRTASSQPSKTLAILACSHKLNCWITQGHKKKAPTKSPHITLV